MTNQQWASLADSGSVTPTCLSDSRGRFGGCLWSKRQQINSDNTILRSSVFMWEIRFQIRSVLSNRPLLWQVAEWVHKREFEGLTSSLRLPQCLHSVCLCCSCIPHNEEMGAVVKINIAMLCVAICIDRQASNIDISHIDSSEIMQIQTQPFFLFNWKSYPTSLGSNGKDFLT